MGKQYKNTQTWVLRSLRGSVSPFDRPDWVELKIQPAKITTWSGEANAE